MINKKFIKENSGLLNKLNLLEEEKTRSRFINSLSIDGNQCKIDLSCKYKNGNTVHLTPNKINQYESDNLNIDTDRLQKELIQYAKNFINREASEKIERVKEKLTKNGVNLV